MKSVTSILRVVHVTWYQFHTSIFYVDVANFLLGDLILLEQDQWWWKSCPVQLKGFRCYRSCSTIGQFSRVHECLPYAWCQHVYLLRIVSPAKERNSSVDTQCRYSSLKEKVWSLPNSDGKQKQMFQHSNADPLRFALYSLK